MGYQLILGFKTERKTALKISLFLHYDLHLLYITNYAIHSYHLHLQKGPAFT
jgi:hypothetical protein